MPHDDNEAKQYDPNNSQYNIAPYIDSWQYVNSLRGCPRVQYTQH